MDYYEPINMIEQADELLTKYSELAARLGLKGLVVSGKTIRSLKKIVEKSTLHEGIDLVSRIDLDSAKVGKIRQDLTKYRKTCEILAVRTASAKVAQWVAKDNRVDILSIPIYDAKKIITKELAGVAATNGTFFEINLAPLFGSKKNSKSYYLRQLTRVMHILLRKKALFLFSIGASSPLDLRDYRTIISFGELFGVSDNQIKHSVQLFSERLTINREKLDGTIIVPGIRKVAATKASKSEKKTAITGRIDDLHSSKDLRTIFSLKQIKSSDQRLERQRYLLFEILSEESITLTKKGLEGFLWDTFSDLFGIVGSSRLGLFVLEYHPEHQLGILRCSHNGLNALRATLGIANKINGQAANIHILKISGTVKNLLQLSKKKRVM